MSATRSMANPVFEFLVNYQNGISREITGNGNEALGSNGGNGAMRLVVIDPDNNTVSTETYFTEFDDYLDGYRVKPETDRDGLTGEYRGHQETFDDVDMGTPDLFAMAKAGDDMFVTATSGEKSMAVTLDAASSLNPKSEALSYAWIDENGDVIATGATAERRAWPRQARTDPQGDRRSGRRHHRPGAGGVCAATPRS